MNYKSILKKIIILIILLTIILINIKIVKSERYFKSTREIIYELCSRKYEGRLVGNRGNEEAGEYIINLFEDLGLSPWEREHYFQLYNQNVVEKENAEAEEGEIRNKDVKNIIGIINGRNNEKAIVLSAHFDSIGYKNGRFVSGALDNASGVAAIIKIAENLKNDDQVYDSDIIFACFNGEESGLCGSQYFAQNIKDRYHNLYDINIDCIGGRKSGKICLNIKSMLSEKLKKSLESKFVENNIEYSQFNNKKEISDNMSFEKEEIANILISQENVTSFIHTMYDTPESLNDNQIAEVSAVISSFIKSHDGEVF